jgi:ABC-type lipoprotein release transport system permease subunit
MRQTFLIASRNLLGRRSRTLILGSAIALVTFILTALLGITSAFQNSLFEAGTALLSGHINVGGFNKISLSSASPIIKDAPRLLNVAKQAAGEDALFITDRVTGFGKIISETGSIQVPMWGIELERDPNLQKFFKLTTKSQFQGATVSLNNATAPGCLAIFESQAKKLGVVHGDGVTLLVPTMRNQNNTKDVKVCAILQDMGAFSDFATFFNKWDAIDIYQLDKNATGFVMIYLKDITKVPEVEERVRKAYLDGGWLILEKDGTPFFMKFDKIANEMWVGEKLDISNWEDTLSFVKWVVRSINAISLLLVIVILISIALGITNALWMSVRERTSEIGTMRSIGMQQSAVLRLFLTEGIILSSIAAGFGLALAYLSQYLVKHVFIQLPEAFRTILIMDSLQLDIRPGAAIFAFSLVSFFALAGSLWPSWRASRMPPVTAIGHVQ